MKDFQDYYFKLAKKEWYVARSAFKLQEIDEKFHFFWPSSKVIIDIGCAPWSRLQYTSRQVQKHHKPSHQEAKIIGFDLKQVEHIFPFVTTFQQDVTHHDDVRTILSTQLWISLSDQDNKNSKLNRIADLIISDMAPDTTSDKASDALRAADLIMQTMRLYEQLLKDNGKFAIKVFMGPGFEELINYCRTQRWHKSIKVFKPKSCRKESKETYIIKI